MDRVISLLAALVGLIALGGAILVHTHSDTQDQVIATQIASLQASLAEARQAAPVQASSAAPSQEASPANALLALQDRIAALEQTTRNQADELNAARTELANRASEAPAQVAPLAAPGPAAVPAAIVADGPTTDCIPIGTRFMAGAGDSFPICKTKVVVKTVAVNDGEAIIDGLGSLVPGGGPVPLKVAGCSVTVFSADTSGYAEMRVACQ